MPYIGARPVIEFSTIPSKDSFTGDGSTTTFDLANEIATGGENALEVFINSVRQEPGSGKSFTLGPDGSNNTKRITFTAAPASGASIYVINDKTNYMTLLNPKDLNGVELVLDADADTSITADTDDRIDLKIGGVEHISFNNSSGDTVIKPMVDAKDIVFQQYDGNKILEINDGNYVAISGAAAGPGELRFYEDTDNGVLYTGFKAGNVTSSVSYVLPLADGTDGYQLATDGSGNLSWAAAGTTFANDGNNRVVTGTGSATLNGEANLTFDGSTLAVTGAATISTTLGVTGVATFATHVVLGDSDILKLGAGTDLTLYHDGSNSYITNAVGALKVATETSGIAITIGHSTSEVTIADNLTVTGTLTLGSNAELTEAELELLDGLTAGTAIASKVVTTDSSIDTTGQRNLTISGELDAATLDISGNADIDGTLEADAITINSTAIGSIYGVVAGSSSILTTGALDSGSITSGFGAIDNGTSNIRSATITAETAFVPDASGGADLGTTALEFNDAFFNDSAVINFGDDQDTTITHTDGTGLTLNSTNKLCFNDTSQFVQGISATVLGLGATDEIDLTATAIDINGTCDISGTFSLGGTTVGSTAAELTLLDGSAKSTSSITVVDADALIVIDGTTTKQIPASDMKTYIGGGTSWQAVKTANFTAAAGQGVFANTTSSAFTITLPAGTIGDEVSIIDYAGTFDSYNLTVAADGSEKIHGSTDDLTVATERAAFKLVFTDGTQGWLLTNN